MKELMKKILMAAAGAIASYYATKTVKAALERKPLKSRMRDGKAKVTDIKNGIVEKAVETKETVISKAAKVKADAAAKAKALYDGDTLYEGGDNGYDHPHSEHHGGIEPADGFDHPHSEHHDGEKKDPL